MIAISRRCLRFSLPQENILLQSNIETFGNVSLFSVFFPRCMVRKFLSQEWNSRICVCLWLFYSMTLIKCVVCLNRLWLKSYTFLFHHSDVFITHKFLDASAQNFAFKYRFHRNASFNFRYCQLSVNKTGGHF